MQIITPFLWFDTQAEEAAQFYTSVFSGPGHTAKLLNIARYGNAGPGPKGSVMTAVFELDGQQFIALNGGPEFKFSQAVSFVVNCRSQAEVDYFWDKLSQGGKIDQCGWLKDKYGLSWQIVPTEMGQLMSDPDPEKANRVMQAMLKMDKIDIGELKRAYNQS